MDIKRIELSSEERAELGLIKADRYAYGAFSGMIFNQYIQGGCKMTIQELIQIAIRVRITMRTL